MTWIQLRSRRDPGVWLPFLLVTLAMAALAVWGHVWLSGWLEGFEATAESDPERAIAEAVRFIRLCEVALLASSLLFCGFLARFFQLALRQARLPPSGWWSLAARRVLGGPEARRMARLGLWLTLLLGALAAATVVMIEALLQSLLAARPTP